tara:strand:+ start:1656 stop:1826 length:171 start_codon:yes stop_codon:yes gene_type:complete
VKEIKRKKDVLVFIGVNSQYGKKKMQKKTTNSVEKDLREARRNNSRVPKVCRRYVH